MGPANAPTNETQIATSPLRGPLLGLLVNQDRPTHAYKLRGRLDQLLPAWNVSHSTVAHLLNRLEAEGLVSSRQEQRKKVYVATERAESARDEWMEKSTSQPPLREELHAMIAGSAPRHAPLLLHALDAYEQECFDRIPETQGAETKAGSWRSLAINLTRAAVDEDLHAKIRWVKTARQWIADFGERGPTPPAR